MTGPELLAEIKKPGAVFIWVAALDAHVAVVKADLRNALTALADLDTLTDIRAFREGDDPVLLIEDFGATEVEIG